MSLPFFKDFGWEAEVVCIDEKHDDTTRDELLLQSIPADTIVHRVKALPKKLTSKFGLGSLALRSLWFYHKKVMLLLQVKNYDLIYFSTTEFPLCILGRYWKMKFKVPYVIDMQDAWHSTYYQDKPKNQRPKKYWFSYRLHRFLEPMAMKTCDGLISVSAAYVDTLHQRYPQLKQKPAAVIPFGAFAQDFDIAKKNFIKSPSANLSTQKINVVYVGRGGADMQTAVELLFYVLKEALQHEAEEFNNLHFYFIGTSYAPKESARQTMFPLAVKFGVEKQVTEITDRLGFYSTLNTLLAADALFVPGSDDPQYTPSKIYPYLLASKQLLAIFHPDSEALEVMKDYNVKHAFGFDSTDKMASKVYHFLKEVLAREVNQPYNPEAIKKYAAENMCGHQCKLFNQVLDSVR
ncbi:MAG: hypothetical protein EOP42_21215 [Sphingobacteriaceae bacterium]|nr:MAG: hypothetical protein EOP42_21215 [Sphingobacteriaceae bacterium]